MSDTPNCPDITRLQALLDGSLPAEAQAGLAAHLETCAHCQRQLELLAGGSALLPRDPAATARRSPALDQAMQRLKGALADETVTVGGTQPGPLTFHFLSRSENPRHLGRMGGYEILELIGRGGMGIVFKARDTKLERLVAIKVLAPELAASAAARRRFQGEAQKMAAVTHDHVVTIHAVDEADGTPFLVMEYIVGVSLEDRIQRSGHLRVEEILRIGLQAASGLAAAHAQGLVHRDIKPGNILLENGVERVKITDFGLARVIHEAQASSSNVIAGTPQYMSPEQAGGEAVDHRSDLFSLGAVLYAMCVGRSPFRADTPTGAIHRVRTDTPRPIREINPDIPEWLVAVIYRLLEKKPEDRFQSATEVAEVLGQYLAHVQQPSRVGLPGPTRTPASSRYPRRLRFWVASVIGIGLVALLAIFGNPPKAPPTPSENDPETEKQLWQAAAETMKADGFYPVDLGPYATNKHREDVVQESGLNNLVDLPTGIMKVDDIQLYIGEGRIQLSNGTSPGAHETIRGIPVDQKAQTIHILQGCAFSRPGHGTMVAKYAVHYDDGSTELIRVTVGRHVLGWWYNSSSTSLMTLAKIGWTGTNPHVAKLGLSLRLSLYSWANPHPEKTITSIDFDYGSAKLAVPFCVAITCDDRKVPPPTEPVPEEPGLLCISTGSWASNSPCRVRVDGASPVLLGGPKVHEVLLPAGPHRIAVFDGEVEIRHGSLELVSGYRKDVIIDTTQSRVQRSSLQVDDLDQLARETIRGGAAEVHWQID